jgi:hypothetical protein
LYSFNKKDEKTNKKNEFQELLKSSDFINKNDDFDITYNIEVHNKLIYLT